MLYMKSKGGFFRSKRHIKIYISENSLIEKNQQAK
jgi:ribosomal protein L19E